AKILGGCREREEAKAEQQPAATGPRPATSEQQPASSEPRTAKGDPRSATTDQRTANSDERPANSERRTANSDRVAIIDENHKRTMDLTLEMPRSPLNAVISHEVWEEYYDRLTRLIAEHRTTLVFVNTRRMAERV